jgi:hypothetical protein
MSSFAFGASKTVAQCAVNVVKGSNGARINLLMTETGEYKANFILGTTVSGTTYHLEQTSPGVFTGNIKNKTPFTMSLKISSQGKANQYINGFASSLTVIYPDLNSNTGRRSLKTTAADEFVCGKKISNF